MYGRRYSGSDVKRHLDAKRFGEHRNEVDDSRDGRQMR
jgi:hypothetical protein